MQINWEELNAQAISALDRGEISRADHLFRNACAQSDFRAYNNLGWFYYVQGTESSLTDSVAEATRWIWRALRLSRHPIILQNAAALCFENKKFAAALELLQEAERSDGSTVLQYNIAVCLARVGAREQAAACFHALDAQKCANELRTRGALHPLLAYAFCVSDEERKLALRQYANQRTDMERLDYFYLCVISGAFQAALDDAEALIAEWQLTDGVLALLAACCVHVPDAKARIAALLNRQETKKLEKLIGNRRARTKWIQRQAFTPALALHNGYFVTQ